MCTWSGGKSACGARILVFSCFSTVLSIRNGFWEELGARWVLMLLPRVGRLHDGARLLWEELWADWVLISSGVKYEECEILF